MTVRRKSKHLVALSEQNAQLCLAEGHTIHPIISRAVHQHVIGQAKRGETTLEGFTFASSCLTVPLCLWRWKSKVMTSHWRAAAQGTSPSSTGLQGGA